MKKIINQFKYWFGISKVSNQMTILDVRITKLQKEKKKSDKELQIYKNQLSKVNDQFNDRMKKINQAIDRSFGLQKKLSLDLEAAQEEIKIAKEITIPGLVAALDTFRTSWDAQSSMDEMRRVTSSSPQREIE